MTCRFPSGIEKPMRMRAPKSSLFLHPPVGERALDAEHSRLAREAYQTRVTIRLAEGGFGEVHIAVIAKVPFIGRASRIDGNTERDRHCGSEYDLGKLHASTFLCEKSARFWDRTLV
jgi:hypothetical protein